jgi:hypothetical protein
VDGVPEASLTGTHWHSTASLVLAADSEDVAIILTSAGFLSRWSTVGQRETLLPFRKEAETWRWTCHGDPICMTASCGWWYVVPRPDHLCECSVTMLIRMEVSGI